jgi:hypothetical protein
VLGYPTDAPSLPLPDALFTPLAGDLSHDTPPGKVFLHSTPLEGKEGAFTGQKTGMPFSLPLQIGAPKTIFCPSTRPYSPFLPRGVESSLASDLRYCMAVSVSAFVLALGSVVLFSHLLF